MQFNKSSNQKQKKRKRKDNGHPSKRTGSIWRVEILFLISTPCKLSMPATRWTALWQPTYASTHTTSPWQPTHTIINGEKVHHLHLRSGMTGVLRGPKPTPSFKILKEDSPDSASHCTYGSDLLQQKDIKQNQQREKTHGSLQRKPGSSF